MGTPRKDGKTQVGVWLTPEERKTLAHSLERLGVKTFADLTRLLISTASWPASYTEALQGLLSVQRQVLMDGRNEVLMVRLNPREMHNLQELASLEAKSKEDKVYELVKRVLDLPYPLESLKEAAGVIGYPAAVQEMRGLQFELVRMRERKKLELELANPTEKPQVASLEGKSVVEQQIVNATIEALKDDPDGLVHVERALEGLTEFEESFYGNPSATDVRTVIRSLAKLDEADNDRLLKRNLSNLQTLRRAWARLLLGAKSSETHAP